MPRVGRLLRSHLIGGLLAGCGIIGFAASALFQMTYAVSHGSPSTGYQILGWTVSAEAACLLVVVVGLLWVRRALEEFNSPVGGDERRSTEAEIRGRVRRDLGPAADLIPDIPASRMKDPVDLVRAHGANEPAQTKPSDQGIIEQSDGRTQGSAASNE